MTGHHFHFRAVCNYRFISISESLPKTGSIKLVEVWMLFSLLVPFFQVIVQTLLNHLLTKAETKVINRTVKHRCQKYENSGKFRKNQGTPGEPLGTLYNRFTSKNCEN